MPKDGSDKTFPGVTSSLLAAFSAGASEHPYRYIDQDGFNDIAAVIPASWQTTISLQCSALETTASMALIRGGNPYAALAATGTEENLAFLNPPADRLHRLIPRAGNITSRSSNHSQRRRTSDIEKITRDLHKQLWAERKVNDPFAILDPELAAKHLGYSFALVENLTPVTIGKATFETAGELDRNSRSIEISRRLKNEAKRFTGAHEIGHILLHKQVFMHRDRPINISRLASPSYDKTEREADIFAAFFLMPRKLLIKEFCERFGEMINVHNLSQDFAFNLSPSNLRIVYEAAKRSLALERMLASAEYFAGHKFMSLAKRFGVSDTAMAIQLRDLGLVSRP
ncbi:ImmA/IrrE family metallo-endopeptidase [Hydrocarboniphaga effusa]|uniref:ImmA/IrrE family metallo-endopeptidase n=1 Tax=Hydrocarboniphaga effusa TaxID=243629 RepID=UPI003137D581